MTRRRSTKRYWRIAKLVLIFIFVFLSLFDFSFANQDVCSHVDMNICDDTPDYVLDLENLVYSLIWEIKVENINQLKQQVQWCWKFVWNLFFQNIIQYSFSTIAILWKPEQVIRDYIYVWDLANLIRDKFFSLCRKGVLLEDIPQSEYEKIRSQFDIYNQNAVIKLYLSDNLNWITRQDLFEIVYRLVNLHKELLIRITNDDVYKSLAKIKKIQFGYCNSRNATTTPSWCKYFSDVKIDKNLLKKIKTSYVCCPLVKTKFFEKLNKMLQKFSWDISKDTQRIIKSYYRLKETLENIWWGLTQYEAEMASKYWNKEFSTWEGWINPFDLKRLQVNIDKTKLKKQLNEFLSPFTWLMQKISNVGKWLITNNWEKIPFTWTDIQNLYQDKMREQFKNTIINTVNDIIDDYNQIENYEIKADPIPITRIYPLISRYINQAIYLIWRRSNKWSITWFLWKACENQCQNVGWICWYY